MPIPQKHPALFSPAELLLHFGVIEKEGLHEAEVVKKRSQFGSNILPKDTKNSLIFIFLRQFKSTIVSIMLVAAILSFALQHPFDGWVIIGIIIVNILIGFSQEFRAEKAILALQQYLVMQVKVRRSGKIQLLPPDELVPGDIILLEEGDKVPADARVIISRNIQTTEAALTGESSPLDKITRTLPQATALTEQTNMVFMGTLVVRGTGEAIVVATGTDSEFGKIAKNLKNISNQPDHYEIKTKKLSSQMATVALFSAGITFIVGFFIRHFGLYEMVVYTIATLVSALPESLPIILVLVLAVGAQRMARRNAVIRRLAATETLGVVSIIITDKTGTLTLNEMRAERILFPGQAVIEIGETLGTTKVERLLSQNQKPLVFAGHVSLEKILTIAGFCNNVHTLETTSKIVGDPTEKALWELATDVGLWDEDKKMLPEKIDDLPFIQELRLRASLLRMPGGSTEQKEVVVIGAPEAILERCNQVLELDGIREWKAHEKKEFQHQIHGLTDQAMRVIGCAYRPVSAVQKKVTKSDVHDLIFVGCIGLFDPPRSEVASAISKAHDAGIRVIMATGDHPKTAVAIGRMIGLLNEKSGVEAGKEIVLTDTDIQEMDDADLVTALKTCNILARLSPSTKLRIAKLFQKQGDIVAMTGDGVNDAPALKQADVGIAMGKNGTDVAREASDIVLVDDNFSSIVSAIEEGRVQFSNVRRTSYFLIATNVSESLALLIALIVGFPLPLLPIQILWLNIVTGGVTDIALTTEKAHSDVMKVGPRNSDENILINNFLPLFATVVITMVALVIGIFIYFLPQGLNKARTAAFVVLSLTQLFNMYTMRSLHKPVLSIGLLGNKMVNAVFMLSLILVFIVLYVPQLKNIFNFVPLSSVEFGMIASISFSVFIVAELLKKFKPAGTTHLLSRK